MEECIVVIPMYSNQLRWYEQISLERVMNVLKEYSICFCLPERLVLDLLPLENEIIIERFSNRFFENIDSYNKMMLSLEFYKRFTTYKYMLIYQLDALVFSDQLGSFLKLNYDYIGAPWFGSNVLKLDTVKSKVGNGGLSLRSVDGCIRLLERFRREASEWKWAEDMFFSLYGKKYPDIFKLAPFSVAVFFSYERMADRCFKYTKNRLPFGCHKWMNFSRDFYLRIFKLLNIDLNSFVNYMRNEDEKDGKMALKELLIERLIRRGDIGDVIDNRLEMSIYGFGRHGKEIYNLLLKCGVRIINVYDERMIKYGNGKMTVCVESFENNYLGEFIVVTSGKYEDEIIKLLLEKELNYGDDFISIYERLYKRIFPQKKYLKSIMVY